MIDSLRLFVKHAIINSDERLVQSVRKLLFVKLNIVCFSEIRCRRQAIFIDEGHKLSWLNDDDARSEVSGIGASSSDRSNQSENLDDRSRKDY